MRGWRSVWWCVQKFYSSFISLLNLIPSHKNPTLIPLTIHRHNKYGDLGCNFCTISSVIIEDLEKLIKGRKSRCLERSFLWLLHSVDIRINLPVNENFGSKNVTDHSGEKRENDYTLEDASLFLPKKTAVGMERSI